MVTNPIVSSNLKSVSIDNTCERYRYENVFQLKSVDALKKSKYDYGFLYMIK